MPDYGFPHATTTRLREITLKGLPEPVRFVADATHDKPALYLIGPLAKGPDGSLQDPSEPGVPRVLPTSVHFRPGGRSARFLFEPGVGEGTYRVAVHASRVRTSADEPMPLLDDLGAPWTGWDLTVVEEDLEAPERAPAPGDGGEAVRQLDRFEVSLDGAPVPSGSSELSGAGLSVVTGPGRRVEVVVEPLARNARTSLYERYVEHDLSAPDGATGLHTHTFRSSGALPAGAAFAVLLGTRTEGRMLRRAEFGGEAVTEDPAPAGPDGTRLATFDLPPNRRVAVLVDGQRVWWGQTRLLPLFVSAERYAIVENGSGTGHMAPSELADLRLRIWRASMEALRLWACEIPTDVHGLPYVPASIEEYVLARLSYGWPRGDAYTGDVFVKLGDQAFEGKTDGASKRRLQELAAALDACELDVDLFPEDRLHAGHAKLASKASPGSYPARRERRSGLRNYPADSTWRSRVDPSEYGRPPYGGGGPLR